MNGRAVNRLTGAVTELSGLGLAGLWASPTEGLLNGLSVAPGTLLLPDVQGVVTWTAPSAQPITVSGPAPAESGFQFGSLDAALSGLALGGQDWENWVGTSPMDSDLADDLQRFPLEEAMEHDLAHLEAVCRQPRTHLEIFEERQLVSRARQIPVRAVTYLASHTEDWEARTLRGVRPRRVITNVRDELYDIYENRVAARLVDSLLRYVRRRLARINELMRGLQTIDGNAQEPPSGMYWRQRRIYRLWGESLDLTEAQLLAAERLEELNRLLYRLERLRASVLYTQVPAKAQVPAQLRITNILGNDPHYRRVARLWLSWHRHAHTGHPSLHQQQQAAQHEAMQFDRYALLLTIHAMDQFEFVPVDRQEVRPGVPLLLAGPEGEVEIIWNQDGTTCLLRAGEEVLRIVATPTALAELRPDEITAVLSGLTAEAAALRSQTVLLYPGSAGQIPVAALQTVSGDPASLHRQLSCLPVSPVDLENVERLARAMRWVLTGARFQAYPPIIESEMSLPDMDWPDIVQPRGAGVWELRDSITVRPVGWSRETIRRERLLKVAEGQLATAQQAHLSMRRAQREVERLRTEVNQWQAFLGAVKAGESALEQIRRCPICATPQADFSAWQDGQFHCECSDCGAQWSLRCCLGCGQRHPWLLPRLEDVIVVKSSIGWADQLYGRDVLTLPDPLYLGGFSCPYGSEGWAR